jgi:hypothetical protein
MEEVTRLTMLALAGIISELDTAIERITLDARFSGTHPYSLRQPDGTYVLAPLITAKANALAALAHLQP